MPTELSFSFETIFWLFSGAAIGMLFTASYNFSQTANQLQLRRLEIQRQVSQMVYSSSQYSIGDEIARQARFVTFAVGMVLLTSIACLILFNNKNVIDAVLRLSLSTLLGCPVYPIGVVLCSRLCHT
jgi:hypothetical protein